jgi:hypothetical protein
MQWPHRVERLQHDEIQPAVKDVRPVDWHVLGVYSSDVLGVNSFRPSPVQRGRYCEGRLLSSWWAHLVGALQVHPHERDANYPPQEVRGIARGAREGNDAISVTLFSPMNVPIRVGAFDEHGIRLIPPTDADFGGVARPLIGRVADIGLQLKPMLVIVSNESLHTVVSYSKTWSRTRHSS